MSVTTGPRRHRRPDMQSRRDMELSSSPSSLWVPRIFGKIYCFLIFFGGNLLVTLKTMKNYNLQANFQKMEKSDL